MQFLDFAFLVVLAFLPLNFLLRVLSYASLNKKEGRRRGRPRSKGKSMRDGAMPDDTKKKSVHAANRSAKLNQSKFDARRDQCLSLVKDQDDDEGRTRRHEHEQSEDKNSRSVESTSKSLSDIEEDAEAIHWEEHEVFDDWEATADALCIDPRICNRDHRSMNSFGLFSPLETESKATYGGRPSKPEPASSSMRDSRFVNASRHERLLGDFCSQQRGILPLPIPCPICCEKLDLTDSSFLPCACGFRLCLFCHKKILETDGRCPGCRKQYDSNF